MRPADKRASPLDPPPPQPAGFCAGSFQADDSVNAEMASWERGSPTATHLTMARLLCFHTLTCLLFAVIVKGQVLTPPYFNLAQGRNISATATCGLDVPNELFCRLTGATGSEDQTTREVIRGQLCDYCNPGISQQDHRPVYATDGTERWWQSPPLSRGMHLNQVNLTIHLGQEFHVAYVFIRMANSPRPGVWVLERSTDFGKTWQAWQFFADTPSDCLKFFETTAEESLYYDDQALCTTEFSKVVPLEGGEIVVSLVNGRPSAENFSNADVLQEWTKATDVQLRMLRTKTLLGHLMAVARQDPTVTRRYYYSIKDISIGGRCVCNGHAETCDRPPEVHGYKLICSCVHNTCGDQCEECCPGFVQKRWRRARVNDPFVCEPCQCYGHSNECVFDEEVEKERRSIDIHGNYDGGGFCQNCRDNTMGVNCEQCVPTYYRPYGVDRSDPNTCIPCECDLRVSTGECEEGSGRCLCRQEYAGLNCDRCNVGYYGYPDCIPCDCHINGTEAGICTVAAGSCPCKVNYDGRKCDMCALGYYNFPECKSCECNPIGSLGTKCNLESGQCECRSNYASQDCSACADGYYGYPDCNYCACDPAGTEEEICDKALGDCLCKKNYTGERCDRCVAGFYGFPNCRECLCQQPGSRSDVCNDRGQCSCKTSFAGQDCGRCAAGYYRYPDCVPCQCDLYGSLSVSCDQASGQCSCRDNFQGQMCQQCKENFYNYPMCEVCNCNPAGSKDIPGYPLGGCGITTVGLLCECKEKVQGRICDQCQPGYWNLDRNNAQGCQECTCYHPGSLTGNRACNTHTGQCMCKPDVGGRDCDICRDGYYDLQENNPFGCSNCMCNKGGSQTPVCNKNSGQCPCRPRVTGKRCDQPIKSHFYPNLHQLKLEIEDGVTPEGYRVRYGYDNYVFPDYSWRGYAILTDVQPEVLLEVNIRIPSLYRIIYRFVNRNEKPVRGDITLTPDSPTDTTQMGEIVFVQTLEPKFATVTSGAVSAFVLNPGRWTISTRVPNIAFLDYFVLIPQDFYEATVLQQHVNSPCAVPGDEGPCLHYQYPDLIGYPFVPGIDAYVLENGERMSVELYPNVNVSSELGSRGFAHLYPNQTSFKMDLVVPEPGNYVLIVSYHNPTKRLQELDVDVASLSGRDQAKVILHSCKFSTLCRQVFTTEEGLVGVYNISTGYVSLTFTGPPGINIGIDSVTAVPLNDWSTEFIRPRIICIRINGVCIRSSYSVPVGTVRTDFELPPNQGRLSIDLPTSVLDPSTGLVQLNNTDREIEIFATIGKPGQYVILFHYYMPTEIGLTLPVTVFVGGQPIKGVFKPTYCPSVTGCRGAIMFGSGNTINLRGDIRILVNNTSGGKIWLDYALLIPAETFTPFDLELQPIDTSGKFLTECINEGFELKSDSEYCRESVFTLTTEFNKGAVQCDCNVDGSLNFNCQAFGGQCQCREYVIGRTCSACQPGYYGFPNCKPCSCPFGVCHPITGDCICPPRVEGDRCDRCQPEAYGYDNLIGCQECNCNPRGVEGGDLNCDQTTGQCNCLANVGGRKCDTCLPGHHTFPYCQACDCDPAGTEDGICDQRNSQCLCKSDVLGRRCDQCPDGSFHLSADNPSGCTRCFCFGTTTRCVSSRLTWDLVNTMDGWGITNTVEGFVIEAGNTIAVKARDDIADTNEALYWVAPPEYLGNKMYSYGGQLIFTVLFTLPQEDSEGIIRPDIILEGNNMTVVHYHLQQPQNSVALDMEVSLFEYNFRHSQSGAEVSREQFMMILHHLQAVHIRASYFTLVDEVRLSDVSMEYASESGPGGSALTVEHCQCPPSYQGTSCQECARGHHRSRSMPYLGICIPCNCNRHSDECDVNTGECFNCQGNTTGPHCEQCQTGYYGDPAREDCRICSCPLPIPSNNFATECRLAEGGRRTYCTCIPGYYGPTCESCAPGHYGNPREVGSYCQPCRCNDNIDVTDPHACDRFTGVCERCMNHTSGDDCSLCRDWYWGDAVTRKDCAACTCDQCGSQNCDKTNGFCECKANIIGSNCDQCAPNTWGYDYCDGCRECECGIGAVLPQCDLRNGRCNCQPGVQGEKCDQCMSGHWNLGPHGCLKCNCLTDGAVGCDENTGSCICLPGVTGPLCDRCLDRWVLVPGQGCQECDYCIHLLLDDLDVLDRNVSTVRRQLADVSVGVAAFNRLGQYNSTLSQLRSPVAQLYTLDRDDLQAMLDPLKQQQTSVESDARETLDKANQAVAQADQLQESVDTMATDAADAEALARDQVISAENAVQHVKQILKQILASIKVTNIQRYITDAERILDDVGSRNFTMEDNSTAEELDKAKDLLQRINMLGQTVKGQLNRSLDMEKNLNDILERLLDLKESAQTSTALKALDDLRRLRAQNLEAIEELTRLIETHDEGTQDLLDKGAELLADAEDAVDASALAFEDLGRDSSRMQQALQELIGKVDRLNTGLMTVEPLVNLSSLHAEALRRQAIDLDNLYNNTRDLSANAVTAGQAYQNIVKFISAAHNNSMEAVLDAERALNETNGNEEKASESFEKSSELSVEAYIVFNTTTITLTDALNDAKDSTEEIEMKKADTVLGLNDVRSQLGELDGRSIIFARAQDVYDRAVVTLDQTNSTDETINRITNLLPQDQKKLESIGPDRTSANLDIINTDSNLETVGTSQDEIKDLLEPLQVNATRLIGVGEKLDLNVQALREKIELAREQANRIRVGLKFLGNTTVTARTPPKLEQTGSYSLLSMYFKTTQTDALLAYIGGQQRSESVQNDFLSLELIDGRAVFKYNLGSGPSVIASNILVNDGQWHQAVAERIGKSGTLTVRTEKKEDDVTEGSSPSTYTVLELNPATINFYLGGIPDDATIATAVTRRSYVGSMEDVMFDDTHVGLWNFEDAENNMAGEFARDVMKEIVTSGMRFNGMGYAVLSRNKLGLRPNRTDILLQFQTFSESGLLVYMSDEKRDFLSIELRDGRVVFQYDLGGGPVSLEGSSRLNDGQWHSISISRSRQAGLLNIDNQKVGESRSPGSLSELSTTKDIFVGGHNQILVPVGNVGNYGFDGCIRDVQFGTIAWDLNDNQKAKGVVRGCPDKVARIATYRRARSDSFIGKDLPQGIGTTFDMTFKMRTNQSKAIMVYVADDTQESAFSVSINEGRIVLKATQDRGSLELVSRINTYNDSNWHFVSIMKDGLVYEMNIDDYEMLQTMAETGTASLDTTTPLYLGGVPPEYRIADGTTTSKNHFVGCIGDITVRQKFVNLVSIPESKRMGVQLVECPLHDEGGEEVGPGLIPAPGLDGTTEEQTTLAPDQCGLPMEPYIPADAEVEAGIRFGSRLHSRMEFSKMPSGMRLRSQFSLSFKTTGKNGLMFYVADKRHIDFMGLFMVDGELYFGFNCGSGPAKIVSGDKYNDGKWHTVSFGRVQRSGQLMVDGVLKGRAKSSGSTRSINVDSPYFFGGVSEEAKKLALGNAGDGWVSFPGCLRELKLRNVELTQPTQRVGIQTCSSAYELGSFFPASGGYLQLVDRFKVGVDLEVSMDLRPRSQSGVLLAVHSSMDYLVLQIVEGNVIFVVDNGAGAISTTFTLPANNALCDGRWHTIKANKNKNVVTLMVDGVESPEPGVGSAKVTAADTNDPLYVGGVPDSGAKAIQTQENYVGCIRNLHLNDQPQPLSSGQVTGDVQLETCPVN